MWYVLQVSACHENEMVNKCREILKDGEEVFTFLAERLERKKGKWEPKRTITFQKYIFADITDPDDFRVRLQKVDGMTKMLGVGEDIVPIKPEEETFLKRIGGEEHIIGLSRGFSEGDKVIVTDGPLQGKEGSIKWMDKRQRTAGIRVKFLNTDTVIKLGIECINKDKSQ